VVSALLPEAGSDGCALLLHDGSFVRDCLCGTHIPNELLHCLFLVIAQAGAGIELGIQEAIVVASRTPPRRFGGDQAGDWAAVLRRGILVDQIGGKSFSGEAVSSTASYSCWLIFRCIREVRPADVGRTKDRASRDALDEAHYCHENVVRHLYYEVRTPEVEPSTSFDHFVLYLKSLSCRIKELLGVN
jgi:hypothetical protein